MIVALLLDLLWQDNNAFEGLRKHVRALLKQYPKNFAFLIHLIIEVLTRDIFQKNKAAYFLTQRSK